MDEPAKTPRSSKAWFAVLVVGALGAYAYVNRAAPESIAWGDDLQAAQTEARARGTGVLVEFTMQGCIYCRKMELEVFPQPDVQEAAAAFVPVKIKLEKDRDTVIRYGVDIFPTFLVLDAEGTPLMHAAGGMNKDQLKRFLQKSSEVVSRVGKPAAAGRSASP